MCFLPACCLSLLLPVCRLVLGAASCLCTAVPFLFRPRVGRPGGGRPGAGLPRRGPRPAPRPRTRGGGRLGARAQRERGAGATPPPPFFALSLLFSLVSLSSTLAHGTVVRYPDSALSFSLFFTPLPLHPHTHTVVGTPLLGTPPATCRCGCGACLLSVKLALLLSVELRSRCGCGAVPLVR